jgi:hypothetical protein
MTSKTVVSVSGFRELDQALAQLPKAIARNVLKRTLAKAAEPIAEAARQAVPVDQGDLKASISVSPRIKNKVGSSEFSAAMRAGLGKDAAVRAMRDARRAGGSSFAETHIGPAAKKGVIRYAHLVEFGTAKMPAEPYMRPAWDAEKESALRIIRAELGNEIIAAARRIGRSNKRSEDIKSRASLAASMAAKVGS